MNTRIAFFRGINVGGNNILPMKELKLLMLELGSLNVRTVIQSGNVVFESNTRNDKLSTDIRDAILKQFGFNPEVIVFSASEFKKIVNATPYQSNAGKHLHYFMMQATPKSPDLALLENIKAATEDYRLIDNVLHLYAPDGIGRSKFVKTVEKAMGIPVTARNQNTLNKLLEKL